MSTDEVSQKGVKNMSQKNMKRMKKEDLTEEKIKERWKQMEEMNAIWDCLTERQKGYLDGCMNTVIALAGESQKKAG